jgi:pyruvate/2-oxoglutarate dehydrogenase complex dihydrolipoamide acyltransferase (E2) component
MRIGRHDADEQSKDPKPTDSTPADAEGLPENEELAKKYAGGKAFDWSRVRGFGKAGRKARAEEKRRKAAESSEEPVAVDAASPLPKVRVPLTRNEMYIAGGVGVFILGLIYFAFLRGDPGLGESLSVSEKQQFERQAQKEMTDRIANLEKTLGTDHPEVQQEREMMRQLKAQANK